MIPLNDLDTLTICRGMSMMFVIGGILSIHIEYKDKITIHNILPILVLMIVTYFAHIFMAALLLGMWIRERK